MIFKFNAQKNKINKKNGGFIPTPTFAKHHECVMESHCKSRCRGFTLVESMTAIFILTLAVVGLMTVVSSSLFAARYSRDDITVNYLLQEAIDYIRNDRDTKVFLSSGAGTTEGNWLTFKYQYSNCLGPNGCTVDVLKDTTVSPKSCAPSTECPYLYFNPNPSTGAFYLTDDGSGMTGMSRTNFRRKIVVTDAGDEMKVLVTISWKNGNLDKSRTLSTSLLRWQE